MGGHFSWLLSFKGAKGGDPRKKISIFFYQKLPNYNIFKVRKKNNHVLYAKYCIIIISAGGGGGPPGPPYAFLLTAPKRMLRSTRNFLTFPKYQKQKNWKNWYLIF